MSETNKRASDIMTARLVLLGLFVASSAIYFPWRLTVFNHEAPIFATLFFTLEVIGFLWAMIFFLTVFRLSKPRSAAAPQELAVDVFIPTYNEPVHIVRRTVIAALRISYPHETWLLDDGNRAEMRAMAEELGCRYIARDKNTHAKAGNLNNALLQAKGEFIAVFDADFSADPRFLDRTLGYFNNPKVALVQTPQEYYNFDSYQHFGKNRSKDSWSEHTIFHRIIQPGRAVFNATMFCGCCAVLRRSALDSIGGIATGTVTEDMHTSVRLNNAGWDSIMHSETLSAGLAPHDAFSFYRQRLRWAQGAMQVFRQEKLLGGCKGLSPMQRVSYMLHVLGHMEGVRHTFISLIPIMTLALGYSPFDLSLTFATWAKYSVPFIVLGVFCFEELSRGYGRLLLNEMFNLARGPSSVRAMGALFDKRYIKFWVTPKIKTKNSAPLFPVILLFSTLVAMAKVGWELAHGTSTLSGWPLVNLMCWASLSAGMAFGLCTLTRRCKVNRREFSRFPVSLPVMLHAQDDAVKTYEAVVTSLSDRGFSLRPKYEDQMLPAGGYNGTIRINGEDVQFNITIRPSEKGQTSGGTLIWETAAQRDAYEYLIISDRIRWLATFDDIELKTFMGAVLPRRENCVQVSG